MIGIGVSSRKSSTCWNACGTTNCLVGVISRAPELAARVRRELEVRTDEGHSTITPSAAG